MAKSRAVDTLPPFRDDDSVHVIVETPAGFRCKLKYEAKAGLFSLGKILPQGFIFPFDFGFIPGTRADDGDPVDALLIAEAGTAPGCLVPARLLGVMKAKQTSAKGKTVRNDRLLAVPLASRQYAELKTMDEMPSALREQLEHFFTSYGALEGKEVRITGLGGPEAAAELVRKSATGRH